MLQDASGNVTVLGNLDMKESGFTRTFKAWASNVTDYINMFHDGTYGILESTKNFVIAP